MVVCASVCGVTFCEVVAQALNIKDIAKSRRIIGIGYIKMSQHAWRCVARTSKEESALFYHLLEGHEGIAAYSTLDGFLGQNFRDVELLVTDGLKEDLLVLLADWKFVEIVSPLAKII